MFEISEIASQTGSYLAYLLKIFIKQKWAVGAFLDPTNLLYFLGHSVGQKNGKAKQLVQLCTNYNLDYVVEFQLKCW